MVDLDKGCQFCSRTLTDTFFLFWANLNWVPMLATEDANIWKFFYRLYWALGKVEARVAGGTPMQRVYGPFPLSSAIFVLLFPAMVQFVS